MSRNTISDRNSDICCEYQFSQFVAFQRIFAKIEASPCE
jgi:hypothetical protein